MDCIFARKSPQRTDSTRICTRCRAHVSASAGGTAICGNTARYANTNPSGAAAGTPGLSMADAPAPTPHRPRGAHYIGMHTCQTRPCVAAAPLP